MSEYTPTEEEVREAFAEYTVDESQHAPWRCEEIRQERRAEFDRFIAKVKAEALMDAAEIYGPGQITGYYLDQHSYTRHWLRSRADDLEMHRARLAEQGPDADGRESA